MFGWAIVVAITHHQMERWCGWEVTLSLSFGCFTTYILEGWDFKSVWRNLGKLPNDICSVRHIVLWGLLSREFSLFHVFSLFSFLQASCLAEPVYWHWVTLTRIVVHISMCHLLCFGSYKALRGKHMLPNWPMLRCTLSLSSKSKAMQRIIIPQLSSWCYQSTQLANLTPSAFSGPLRILQILWNFVLKYCHWSLLGKFSFDLFESCVVMLNSGQTFIIFLKVTCQWQYLYMT
jgi:hypothetical protein